MQTINNLPLYHLQINTRNVHNPQDLLKAFIYTESAVHMGHNTYIHLHFDELDALCQEYGERFIYIPRLYHNLIHSSNISYYDPSGINIGQHLISPFSLSYLNNILSTNGYIQHNQDYNEPGFYNAQSLLLHNDESDEHIYNLLGYDLSNQDPNCILDFLRSYYTERTNRAPSHDHSRSYSSTEEFADYNTMPPYDADDYFDEESQQLLFEVREKLDALRMKGFDSLLLSKILSQPQRLSRICITHDYKILLPDYNKEVLMKPLPKTVYFLFLCHPEGIRFKNLGNYRKELQHIYLRITHRTSDEKISKSLDDLCDPTNNSINEKCARIREAFLNVMNDDIARHYYIVGARGEAKGIHLSQEMRILDEANLGLSIYDVFNADMISAIAKWMNNNKDTFPANTESQEILYTLMSALRRANNKRINEMKNRLKGQLPLFTTNNAVVSLNEVSINNTEGVANLISAVGNTSDRKMWEFYRLAENHHPLIQEYIQSQDWQ